MYKRQHQDNAKVAGGFVQNVFIARSGINAQRFHTASEIADTHGAGKGISVDLAECLNLHGA